MTGNPRLLALERLEADDAGGRLLGARDDVAELLTTGGMEDADDVGAVVHRDVGLVVGGRLDVRVVRVVVLALDGEDGGVELLHERGSDVVLRGQRVRGAQHDVRPARDERAHEVRGSRS